nr:FecR domain-containing protein [Chitinophagaceae bacterium]
MTEELIQRFFSKQCTAPEAEEVSQFLKDNPAALEKYLDAREWFSSGSQQMPDEFWNSNWAQIKEQRTSVSRIAWLKRAAAAAIIIISAGLAYQAFSVKEKPVVLALNKSRAVNSVRKITVNNSAKMMSIHLPDSSEVVLSPGSLITYNNPFAGDKREVTLDGEARFSVMKNEQKPFTVFAGGLATTALGTEFT